MPPYTSVLPVDPITFTAEAGETSNVITREIWNDKEAAHGDAVTAAGVILRLLAAPIVAVEEGEPVYGPLQLSGIPSLDERWARCRIVDFLSTPDGGETVVESTNGTGQTQVLGANAWASLGDIEPQHGVRLEITFEPPGGRGPFDFRMELSLEYDVAAMPLALHTALATGGSVIPPERNATLLALLDGSEVTADGSDTVTVAAGHMVSSGTVLTFLEEDVTFTLADSAAVDLGSGEDYLVTLSRDEAGVIAVTKSTKAATEYPDVAADHVYVERLTVSSPDGVAVAVSAVSLIGGRRYVGFHARAGSGLTILVSAGDAISDSDLRMPQSHEVPVNLTASTVNSVWFAPGGSWSATASDAAPAVGAVLMYRVTTDGGGIVAGGIEDARQFAHRALTMWHHEFAHQSVLSTIGTAHAVALVYFYEDTEIEAIEMNLSDVDPSWTAGAVKADLRIFAPGAPVPFPAGGLGTGGASVFTSSGTHDERPVIAFDATDLRAITKFHEVRRIAKGSRGLLSVISTIAAPSAEPEQEVRVAIHGRRWR